MVDNTRGEPEAWAKEQIRSQSLMLTVTANTPDGVELRLDGEAILSTDVDATRPLLYGTVLTLLLLTFALNLAAIALRSRLRAQLAGRS